VPWYVTLFSESASRAVVSVTPERAPTLEDLCAAHDVPCARIGETGGPRLVFDTLFEIGLDEATAIYEEAIPKRLAG
jgi:phosphoribosylformylglycinamidine synthase